MTEDLREIAQERNELGNEALARLCELYGGLNYPEWIFTFHPLTVREMDIGTHGDWGSPWDTGIWIPGSGRRWFGHKVYVSSEVPQGGFGLIERALWDRAHAAFHGSIEAGRSCWDGRTEEP